MTRNMRVLPGKLVRDQAWVGAIVAAMFLVFGLTFAFVVLGDLDQAEDGLRILIVMFFVIWTVVCCSMLIFYVRIASNRQDNSIVEIRGDGSESPSNSQADDDG